MSENEGREGGARRDQETEESDGNGREGRKDRWEGRKDASYQHK